jgi:hypothetical protein
MFIENRPQVCRHCGEGPWQGRETSYVDKRAGEIVVECTWMCGRCNNTFASGVISRTPIQEPNEKTK